MSSILLQPKNVDVRMEAEKLSHTPRTDIFQIDPKDKSELARLAGVSVGVSEEVIYQALSEKFNVFIKMPDPSAPVPHSDVEFELAIEA